MIFHSFYYIFLFLPLTTILYFLQEKNLVRNFVLILSSYLFYSWGNPYLALLLFLSSFIDFFIGENIEKLNSIIYKNNDLKLQRKIQFKKKCLLFISLFFNIGILLFFKYWDWFIGIFSLILIKMGFPYINPKIFQHQIEVPPGISFYTFQTLSYTIDIYRRDFNAKNSIVTYFSFVAFFPQLIAGPIERAKDLLPQLSNLKKVTSGKILEQSISVIAWGLFKKLVFADNFGHLVNRCEENINIPGAGLLLLVAFSFQIYCDFSAYSDIARGTARIFGIKLKRNFLTPYFAINPSDFWRRWHISLSKWVKDYIYIPLGGNRCSITRNIFNLLLTMTIMGLWHGANKFFPIWGLYHGALLIFYRLVPISKFLIDRFGKTIGYFIAIALMYFFNLIGWLFFFSKSTEDFIYILKSFIQTGFILNSNFEYQNIFLSLLYGLIILLVPILITELIGFKYNREFTDILKIQNYSSKIFLYLIVIYGIIFFGSRGSYDFIYFQF